MSAIRAVVAPGLAIFALSATAFVWARADASAPPQDAAATTAPRTLQIYRCTDAAGRVTLQNDVPCPKGSRQERQSVDVPPPLPAYVPREERMPDIVAAERADEAAAIAAAVQPAPAAATDGANAEDAPPAAREPPPALYACRTWDNADYLTADAEPAERCAPLQVVGMDGVARADAAACEKVVDQCVAVPAEQLCRAWRRRVDEAEFRWKFAGAKQDDDRRRDYELLKATLDHADCPRQRD